MRDIQVKRAGSAKRIQRPKRSLDTWLVAAIADDGRVSSLLTAPGTIFLRAFDGSEVTLAGRVIMTSSSNRPRIENAAEAVADKRAHRLPKASASGWRAAGDFSATSPDGRFVAQLMELLAVDRTAAPEWFLAAIKAARHELRTSATVGRFYEALMMQGVAASPTAGQWGTCDFDEWRHRDGARTIDAFAIKLFAIHCVPRSSTETQTALGTSDVVGMCETVAPAAYFVSVRDARIRRIGANVGVDLVVEAGHVPPADWMDATHPAPARFEIAAPLGARGNVTLVVPPGERSSVRKVHFDLRSEAKTMNVTVFDECKRRYDLPIDLA